MEFSPKDGEVFHPDQVVAGTAELADSWRAEVAAAADRRQRRVDRKRLTRLFEGWNREWLEPGLLAYVILGCEWLFRARLGTIEDIDRELMRVEAQFCNPARGVLEPDQASLLIGALRPAITRELKEKRFLISLGSWAVRDRFARWRLFGQAKRDGPPAREVTPVLVKRKPGGPIAKPGPAVAGLAVEGIALEQGRPAPRAAALGLLAAEALLGRAVPTGERTRWRERFDISLAQDHRPESTAPTRRTLREWLIWRFERGYSSLPSQRDWASFLEQCRQEPRKAFDLIADPQVVALIYELPWGADDPSPAKS